MLWGFAATLAALAIFTLIFSLKGQLRSQPPLCQAQHKKRQSGKGVRCNSAGWLPAGKTGARYCCEDPSFKSNTHEREYASSFFWSGMETPQKTLSSKLMLLGVSMHDENHEILEGPSTFLTFTSAIPTLSHPVRSIKPHEQDKYPVTSDQSSMSCSSLTQQKAPLSPGSWRGTLERLCYLFLLREDLANRAVKDITFNWPFAYL